MESQSTHSEASDDELYGLTLIGPFGVFSSASTP